MFCRYAHLAGSSYAYYIKNIAYGGRGRNAYSMLALQKFRDGGDIPCLNEVPEQDVAFKRREIIVD